MQLCRETFAENWSGLDPSTAIDLPTCWACSVTHQRIGRRSVGKGLELI